MITEVHVVQRLTKLESEVSQLLQNQEKREQQMATIDGKLDDLLDLRNKGIGAFWLATSLLGTGLVGTVLAFIDWIKG